MAKLQTLNVYANPYTFLNADAEPMGVFPWDPQGDNPQRGFVGATLKAEITEKYPPGDGRTQRQRNTFDFSHDPVLIPDTPHYRHAIRHGELIVADEATAKTLGVDFADPEKVLADHKATALKHWAAAHGEAPPELLAHAFGPPVARKLAAEAKAKAKAEADAKLAAEAAKAAETAPAPESHQEIHDEQAHAAAHGAE